MKTYWSLVILDLLTNDQYLLRLDWLHSRRNHGQLNAPALDLIGFSLLHDRVFQSSQSLHFDPNRFSVAEPALRFPSRTYS